MSGWRGIASHLNPADPDQVLTRKILPRFFSLCQNTFDIHFTKLVPYLSIYA